MRFWLICLTGFVITWGGCSSEKEIHPGLDFPAAWLPEGVDKAGYQVLEEYAAKQRLVVQKSDFSKWCRKHGFDVDKDRLARLQVIDGKWIFESSEEANSFLASVLSEPDPRLRRLMASRNALGDSFTLESSWDEHPLLCEWHLNPNAAQRYPSSVIVKVPRDFKPHQVEGAILKAWGTCDPQPVFGAEIGLLNASEDALAGAGRFTHDGWDFLVQVHDRGDHYLCDVVFRLSP